MPRIRNARAVPLGEAARIRYVRAGVEHCATPGCGTRLNEGNRSGLLQCWCVPCARRLAQWRKELAGAKRDGYRIHGTAGSDR